MTEQRTGDYFEDGVVTQVFVGVLIFVIGKDTENPMADQGNEALSSEVQVTTIVERICDLPGESGLFIELADGGSGRQQWRELLLRPRQHWFLVKKTQDGRVSRL